VKGNQKGKNVKILSFNFFNNKYAKTIAVLFARYALALLFASAMPDLY
jgi:hypothetical protein